MYIKLLSDLHLEADPAWRPEEDDLQKETVLFLAGDICEIERSSYLEDFLLYVADRYEHVFHVPGNHEYYGGHIKYSAEKLENIASKISNVTILNNKSVMYGRLKIIGTTLWTDCDKGNPYSKLVIEDGLNDYRKIRIDSYRKLRVNDTISLHLKNLKFLKKELEGTDNNAIIITHHAPSHKSIHPNYIGDELNGAYNSDLSDLMLDYKPILWCHGHTHDSFDYEIGNTRVLCNPRGYPRGLLKNAYENVNFNEAKIISI